MDQSKYFFEEYLIDDEIVEDDELLNILQEWNLEKIYSILKSKYNFFCDDHI